MIDLKRMLYKINEKFIDTLLRITIIASILAFCWTFFFGCSQYEKNDKTHQAKSLMGEKSFYEYTTNRLWYNIHPYQKIRNCFATHYWSTKDKTSYIEFFYTSAVPTKNGLFHFGIIDNRLKEQSKLTGEIYISHLVRSDTTIQNKKYDVLYITDKHKIKNTLVAIPN